MPTSTLVYEAQIEGCGAQSTCLHIELSNQTALQAQIRYQPTSMRNKCYRNSSADLSKNGCMAAKNQQRNNYAQDELQLSAKCGISDEVPQYDDAGRARADSAMDFPKQAQTSIRWQTPNPHSGVRGRYRGEYESRNSPFVLSLSSSPNVRGSWKYMCNNMYNANGLPRLTIGRTWSTSQFPQA